jgi:SAM-dependent methyltransferase
LEPAAQTFDPIARDYEAAVERGVRLSGEERSYFSLGRVAFLGRELRRRGAEAAIREILDFGCGTGLTSLHLLEAFPSARLAAADPSARMLDEARRRASGPRARFLHAESADLAPGQFDLVYAANVFHHIEPTRRHGVLRDLHAAARPGGWLAVFENNPWNPGARAVMARVSFDDDAAPLSVLEARRLVHAAGFRVACTRSLFYFPRFLSALRPLEPWLAALPFGAQHAVLARKDLEGRA